MIEISMSAALMIYSVCFVIGFVFVLLIYLTQPRESTLVKYVLLFYALSSIGTLMIVYRVQLGTFVSIIVANSIMVVANMLLVYGIRRFIHQKNVFIYYVVAFSLFLLLILSFTYIHFHVMTRVYVYNLLVMGVIFYGVLGLIKARKTVDLRELMTISLLFIILVMLFRIGVLTFRGEEHNSFLDHQVDPLLIIFVGISNLTVVSGLFSLDSGIKRLALIENERSKTSLLSNLPGFAYRCKNDESWTMEFLSSGFETLTGYKDTDVLNNRLMSFEEIILPEFRDEVREGWGQSIAKKRRHQCEYQILDANKEKIWVWEQGIGIYDDEGECIAIEGFIADIDNRKNMERSLEFLSYRDSLTGLYNRRFIEEQLERISKSRNIPISIIMADINGLKFVNDSFGHDHGDKLIQNVGQIFSDSLRGNELVSRLSGDEFLVILENTSFEDTTKIVERIQRKCRDVKYIKMGLSIAIGYATKENKEQEILEVRKQAEDMMYKQKLYQKPSIRRKTVDAVLGTLFEKDPESERHSRNVSKYSKDFARYLSFVESDVRKIETAGLLHDVGKIITDDRILKSTSKLTKVEYEEIKKHAEIGYRILVSVPEFKDIAEIILHHHERIDGKGYPNNVHGENIPLMSKMITICDAFDAMVNKRQYREPISEEEAFDELLTNRNKQFDSELVEKFIEMRKMKKIEK